MYVPTVTETIQRRRYQILVHSYLYYQLDDNIIDDHTYDMWGNHLVALQEKFPEESKEARYYDEFKHYDGSSGFDLPFSLPNIQAIGNELLMYRGNMEDGKWRVSE